MSKKVFSKEKFLEWKERFVKQDWWEICDGLIEEEMSYLGYETIDDWMIEVEDGEI